MFHAQIEASQPVQVLKSNVQPPCRIFTEHQILTIGQGESLFVCTLHCGLHRGAQSGFCLIDQFRNRQFANFGFQANVQCCGAALAMWGCHNALRIS
ncbi:hypothetical protein D9M71_669720 [compost metagenome]